MLYSLLFLALLGLFQTALCASWPPALQFNPVAINKPEKPVWQYIVPWDAAAHGGHPPTIEQGEALSKAVFDGIKNKAHAYSEKKPAHMENGQMIPASGDNLVVRYQRASR